MDDSTKWRMRQDSGFEWDESNQKEKDFKYLEDMH